ncbi:predicted protein [Sclerotinia sclerotiorum 1980 UF-70]|uniref:Uncharacterized protein n=1 Tax=Sclerotinia sclerotiorum (strain ATCC 18683 / 1980 / Ss-1) TaxID=665079 RepID=A7EMU5_SCLS1|nr:predicted protein [Sclerotinia sclerotiorum 1980 UF-70]EDO04161.1 predicted protein [Sclerotinia sclerotiorum 1980 UF-70]
MGKRPRWSGGPPESHRRGGRLSEFVHYDVGTLVA